MTLCIFYVEFVVLVSFEYGSLSIIARACSIKCHNYNSDISCIDESYSLAALSIYRYYVYVYLFEFNLLFLPLGITVPFNVYSYYRTCMLFYSYDE
jgi:hypothetical protein